MIGLLHFMAITQRDDFGLTFNLLCVTSIRTGYFGMTHQSIMLLSYIVVGELPTTQDCDRREV